MVQNYMERVGRGIVWRPIFRSLLDVEERQFITLLELLNNVDIPKEGGDCKIWDRSRTNDGYFSVSSFYKSISNKQITRNTVAGVWNNVRRKKELW